MTITLTREEAQRMLSELEDEIPFYSENDCPTPEWITDAIELLRTRLAQPEPEQRTGDCLLTGVCAAEGHRIQKAQPEPKPVAWADRFDIDRDGHDFWVNRQEPAKDGVPLYTAPPQREWQGLTDEEKQTAYAMFSTMSAIGFVQAIEAKLKEKNT